MAQQDNIPHEKWQISVMGELASSIPVNVLASLKPLG